MIETVVCASCGSTVRAEQSAAYVEEVVMKGAYARNSWTTVFDNAYVDKAYETPKYDHVVVVAKQAATKDYDDFHQGETESIFLVFEYKNVFYRIDGTANSYNGTEFHGSLRKVLPKTVEVVTYE